MSRRSSRPSRDLSDHAVLGTALGLSAPDAESGPSKVADEGAALAALRERSNAERASNDFLLAWQRSSGVATDDTSATLQMLSEDVYRGVERRWSSLAKGGVLGVRPFVAMLAMPLVECGAFDTKGRRTGTRVRRPRAVSLAEVASSGGRSDSGSDADPTDDVEATLRAFPANCDVLRFLGDLFRMVDASSGGGVTWDAFITFIIESAYSHGLSDDVADISAKRGVSTEEGQEERLAVNPMTGTKAALRYTGTAELEEPEGNRTVTGLRYFPAWNAVVALSKQTTAVWMLEDLDAAWGTEPVRPQGGTANELSPLRALDRSRAQRAALKARAPKSKASAKEEPRKASSSLTRAKFAALAEGKGTTTVELGSHEPHLAVKGESDQLGQYLRHEGTVQTCEHLRNVGMLVTVSNTTEKQFSFYNIHLRRELSLLRHLRIPMPQDSAVSVVREYHRGAELRDRTFGTADDTSLMMVGTRAGQLAYTNVTNDLGRKSGRPCDIPLLAVESLHDKELTDCLVLPRTGRVATCGLDTNVVVHHPNHGRCATFRGHEKGVYTLAYCSAFEVILSGGYEYRALCWAENLPNAPAFFLHDTTNPHVHPLSKIIAVEGTPQVYTIDTSGTVKLFDVRSLKAIETWRGFEPGRVPLDVASDVHANGARMGEVTATCYTGPQHRSILCGAKRLHGFHTEVRGADAHRAHDAVEPIVAVALGPKCVVTATAVTVRCWALSTGAVTRTLDPRRYVKASIAALAVDPASDMAYFGYNEGSVVAVGLGTGVLRRRYQRHDAAITALYVDPLHHLLVSADARGEVYFWALRDCVLLGRSFEWPLRHLHGEATPIPRADYRPLPPPPPHFERHFLWGRRTSLDPLEGHRWALARWAAARWRALCQRRRKRKAGAVPDDQRRATAEMLVTAPWRELHLRVTCSQLHGDPRRGAVVLLSRYANCRVVDYRGAAPRVTHKMYHGAARELTAAAFMAERNLVAVGDIYGSAHLWLCSPHAKEAVLLSKWRVDEIATTMPLGDFYRAPPEDLQHHANELLHYETEETAADVALCNATAHMAGQPSEGAVGKAAITAIALDPVKHYVIVGDELGRVTTAEIDTVYREVADPAAGVLPAMVSGARPRPVLSWPSGESPCTAVGATCHTMHAVFVASADNTVGLWTTEGEWLAGLRQGPIPDRHWAFPNAARAAAARLRTRGHKLAALRHSPQELQRIAGVPLGESEAVYGEPMLRDLLALERGDTQARQTRVPPPPPTAAAAPRRAGGAILRDDAARRRRVGTPAAFATAPPLPASPLRSVPPVTDPLQRLLAPPQRGLQLQGGSRDVAVMRRGGSGVDELLSDHETGAVSPLLRATTRALTPAVAHSVQRACVACGVEDLSGRPPPGSRVLEDPLKAVQAILCRPATVDSTVANAAVAAAARITADRRVSDRRTGRRVVGLPRARTPGPSPGRVRCGVLSDGAGGEVDVVLPRTALLPLDRPASEPRSMPRVAAAPPRAASPAPPPLRVSTPLLRQRTPVLTRAASRAPGAASPAPAVRPPSGVLPSILGHALSTTVPSSPV